MKKSIAYGLVVALVGALTVAGCSSTDNNTGTPDSGTTGGTTTGGATPVTAKFSSLYASYFQNCKNCHTPTAPGRKVGETEASLDFSTEDTAYTTLSGKATGLVGNNAGCNGQKFIIATKPSASLVVAVLDETVRAPFTSADVATCDADAIPDMTQKVGFAPPAEFVTALKEWITNGAEKN